MAFIIKTQKGYIKRTSNFGMFHGNIVLTDNEIDAYRFTRKSDAERRGHVAEHRTKEACPHGIGWDRHEGYDRKKFGVTLKAEVLEVV